MQIRLNKNNMNRVFQQSWIEKRQLLSHHSKSIWLFFMSFNFMPVSVQWTKKGKKEKKKSSPEVFFFPPAYSLICLYLSFENIWFTRLQCSYCRYWINLFFPGDRRFLLANFFFKCCILDKRCFICFETTLDIFHVCQGKEPELI